MAIAEQPQVVQVAQVVIMQIVIMVIMLLLVVMVVGKHKQQAVPHQMVAHTQVQEVLCHHHHRMIITMLALVTMAARIHHRNQQLVVMIIAGLRLHLIAIAVGQEVAVHHRLVHHLGVVAAQALLAVAVVSQEVVVAVAEAQVAAEEGQDKIRCMLCF